MDRCTGLPRGERVSTPPRYRVEIAVGPSAGEADFQITPHDSGPVMRAKEVLPIIDALTIDRDQATQELARVRGIGWTPATGVIHRLKVWPAYIGALQSRSKPFEARKDDRNYRVGDVLELYEWNPITEKDGPYTERFIVSYILRGPAFGVEVGHVIMGIHPWE